LPPCRCATAAPFFAAAPDATAMPASPSPSPFAGRRRRQPDARSPAAGFFRRYSFHRCRDTRPFTPCRFSPAAARACRRLFSDEFPRVFAAFDTEWLFRCSLISMFFCRRYFLFTPISSAPCRPPLFSSHAFHAGAAPPEAPCRFSAFITDAFHRRILLCFPSSIAAAIMRAPAFALSCATRAGSQPSFFFSRGVDFARDAQRYA